MEVHSGDIYRLSDGSVWIILYEELQDKWAGFCLKPANESRPYFVEAELETLKSDLVILGATSLTGEGTWLLKLVADKLLERENA